jgi:hypothetical protein
MIRSSKVNDDDWAVKPLKSDSHHLHSNLVRSSRSQMAKIVTFKSNLVSVRKAEVEGVSNVHRLFLHTVQYEFVASTTGSVKTGKDKFKQETRIFLVIPMTLFISIN